MTPVFNRKNFTKNFLEALKKQTVTDFTVVIVDDGSTDGTAQMIEDEFPGTILLKEEGDLWWAEATNVGIRYALENNASYILTLNDDTLPEEDFMEKMVFWAQKKPRALLGALQVDEKTKKIVYGGELRSWMFGKYTLLANTLGESERHGLHEVSQFPGRGLLIPIEVFKTIGLYDSKNFPQTVADLDFTHRAVHNGYEIYCNYDAKINIYPDESATSKIFTNKSLPNYFKHLFSIKGGGNLIFFSKCAWKNCPKQYLPSFLFVGIMKRLIGYFVK